MGRTHAYVSFTDRVSSIRIDPIRRSERNRNAPDASETESLFMSALERWKELNLASHFTQFYGQCAPKAQSLPMILYNQSSIFDLLVASLRETDIHSAEPLLDLLVQFARDLGEDFEQYFATALRTCIEIIEKYHRDDEALDTIELTFNCLAYLFKYLSRLLTTNLVPTYDLLLPLFGGVKGTKWRPFVLRFAAESMAFLVRRASGEGLSSIVSHIVGGVAMDKTNLQYVSSSSQLLAATMKGPQISLHSKTPLLLQEYYRICHELNMVDLFCGTLTELLHHTRQSSAKPIYVTCVDCVKMDLDDFGCCCLFVLAGLRKGDRVNDWDPLFEVVTSFPRDVQTHLCWIQAAGAVLSFADTFTTTKHLPKLLEKIPDLQSLGQLMRILRASNPEAYASCEHLFWEFAFKKTGRSDDHDLKILALLSIDLGLPNDRIFTEFLKDRLPKNSLPIVASLRQDQELLPLFDLWWRAHVYRHNLLKSEISSCRDVLGQHVTDPALKLLQVEVSVSLLKHTKSFVLSASDFQGALLASPHFGFLEFVLSGVRASLYDKNEVLSLMAAKLYESLRSCDRKIRRIAIDLLAALVEPVSDPEFLLDQCGVINDLPQDLENARNIGHRLRTLATKYKLSGTNTATAEVLSEAVMNFFFGMLTTRLQPVSSAVLELIPKLSEKDPKGVCKNALTFIEDPESVSTESLNFGDVGAQMDDSEPPLYCGKLDCNTLDSLQSASEQAWLDLTHINRALQDRARDSLNTERFDDLRALGIKALLQVPNLSEKHALSYLVPYLLKADEDDQEAEADPAQPSPVTFNQKVLLLELLAKMRHVERLPLFSEIRKKYLYFLSSRHAPLQQLGFKCLIAADSPETKMLRKYRTNFEALFDEKRFRDELVTLINSSESEKDESSLHDEDRAVVMPYLVRVLYGRAQNSTKRNMRFSVLSSLHSVELPYLQMFVNLAHDHLDDSQATSEATDFSDRQISRKVQGYLSLIGDLVHHLKTTMKSCIPMIMDRGIIPILKKLDTTEHKLLRQLVTKAVEELLSSVPKRALWEAYYGPLYRYLIEPQVSTFAARNHESPSTLIKLILTISGESELVSLIDTKVLHALASCLENPNVKDPVIIIILRVAINVISLLPASEATQLMASSVVRQLPTQMARELSPECFAVAIEATNKIFSMSNHIFDEETVENIALVAFAALEKPSRTVSLPVKGSTLGVLCQIFGKPSCSEALIETGYQKLAPLFKLFVSSEHRIQLSSCYQVFGERRRELARVGGLIVDLNSIDAERLGEPDYGRRSAAFEEINEKLWSTLTPKEWWPLMFNMIFFMKDPNELAFRNNGKYSLMRLIESGNAPDLVNDHVLPAIKRGLRDDDDKFRRLYVDLLGQTARYDILPSMKVLLYQGDEEADFFINVNHVQVHRRRRAIQRLGKHADKLAQSDIAHYLLSIAEHFASFSGSKNSELNNLADDALTAITELLKHVSEGQFKSVARRCVQNVLLGPEPAKLRKSTRVLTAVAQATPSGLDSFVLNVLVAPLHRFLSGKSNEHENLPDRIPLAVAIIYFMKSLEPETLELKLPGKLTPLCQLLRSKIPEMRDTVRQSLGRIARILGTKYLSFLISELYGSLRKGGLQSHVLGYTVHSILVELNRPDGISHVGTMTVGGLDDSAGLIFRVVINDTFGTVGDDKDNDNYVTTAKEVKHHKSYDTAEILANWTSLSQFGKIIEPIRDFLCSKKLSARTEHKVGEVLRRLSAGVHRNPQVVTQDAVIMGYEIFKLCDQVVSKRTQELNGESRHVSESTLARERAAKESEEFFTVRLSSRDWYSGPTEPSRGDVTFNNANTRYAPSNLHLLQTLALDILRSVMTATSGGGTNESGKGLLTVANVRGLLPIMLTGFESTHEDLNIASLRLAATCLRLPIPLAEDDTILADLGARTLHFIESSPDTNSPICQTSLKFLTVLLRSKPEFQLNSGAVAYIFDRMRPDLEEPERQGTAISFVRAVFSRKYMLPQVYDIADTLSKVLVTNQSEHIRANCRAAYLHFLISFPLGQTRLNRHLASLGANLRYEAPAGRLSVMEMIHTLLKNVQTEHLEPSYVEYFASLVLLLVTDTEPLCRKRARSLIEEIIATNQSTQVHNSMIEHCTNWIGNFGKNNLLARGALEVASLLTSRGDTQKLKAQLHQIVVGILEAGQRASQSAVEWQLVYLALDYSERDRMDLVEGVLLYPHPWVRTKANRVFGGYFKESPRDAIPLELLIRVGYKLARQLGAPRLDTNDCLQIVKNLVFILPIWDSKAARMDVVHTKKHGNEDGACDQLCIDWLVHKLGSTIRTDASAGDLVGSKTAAVQVIASIPSLLCKESLERVAYELIMSLYVLIDQLTTEEALTDLRDLAQDALSFYDEALGTTEYLKRYTEAQQFVYKRRQERRAKRSIEAVTDPEAFAKKKLKRNIHKHDARKARKQRS